MAKGRAARLRAKQRARDEQLLCPKIKFDDSDDEPKINQEQESESKIAQEHTEGYQSAFAPHGSSRRVQADDQSPATKPGIAKFLQHALPPRPSFGPYHVKSTPSGFAQHKQPPKVNVDGVSKEHKSTQPLSRIPRSQIKALEEQKRRLEEHFNSRGLVTIFDPRRELKAAAEPETLRLKLAEGKHLFGDPLMSPLRFLSCWNDDALAASWAQSLRQGQIKDLPEVKLELRRSTELSDNDRNTCLDIVQYTSKDAYQSSRIGWHRSQKKTEMSDKNMMYILVRTVDGQKETFGPGLSTDIIGFASFKIDYDDPPNGHRHIVYIFEVHIGLKFRGKGLGKWLVFTVEAMTRMVSINKTMLTVFKSNAGALKAYHKMGYVKDDASPADRIVRKRLIESEYLIMSKSWSAFGSSTHEPMVNAFATIE